MQLLSKCDTAMSWIVLTLVFFWWWSALSVAEGGAFYMASKWKRGHATMVLLCFFPVSCSSLGWPPGSIHGLDVGLHG